VRGAQPPGDAALQGEPAGAVRAARQARAPCAAGAYSGQLGQPFRPHPGTRSGPPGRDRSGATVGRQRPRTSTRSGCPDPIGAERRSLWVREALSERWGAWMISPRFLLTPPFSFSIELCSFSSRPFSGSMRELDAPGRGAAPGRALCVGGARWSGQVVVSSVLFPPSPFVFRIDGPFSDSTCALWTSRSQIASATVGSASISCQLFVGTWLVTTVERWS
jgi:hypothetical protein